MKHKCGCVTERFEDGIKVYACKKHSVLSDKWIWIGLQHKDKAKKVKPK